MQEFPTYRLDAHFCDKVVTVQLDNVSEEQADAVAYALYKCHGARIVDVYGLRDGEEHLTGFFHVQS